jgi:uncharacterized protein YfdQ (DUF2303 family)
MTETSTTVAADTLRDMLALGAVHTEPVHGDNEDGPDGVYAVVPQGYALVTADLSHMKTPAHPRRVTGTITVTDTRSWLAYFDKYGDDSSEVFGDVHTSSVTALLNAPSGPDVPEFADHRLVLGLSHSPAWLAWVRANNTWMTQTAFAEHLEDRQPDLVEPDAATMLELAQSFQATSGVQFESGSSLHSGQRRFKYMETVEGRAGTRGELAIPTSITIQVPVWRGVAIVVPMTARFRFRAESSGLKLGYVLDRLEDTLDAAWTSLLGELTEALPVPVLAGKAPTYGRS